jgi:hypothetical protein
VQEKDWHRKTVGDKKTARELTFLGQAVAHEHRDLAYVPQPPMHISYYVLWRFNLVEKNKGLSYIPRFIDVHKLCMSVFSV